VLKFLAKPWFPQINMVSLGKMGPISWGAMVLGANEYFSPILCKLYKNKNKTFHSICNISSILCDISQ
jgi:hypothetical protein